MDTILTEIGTKDDVFTKVADTAEEIIWVLPREINAYRDLSKMYHPVEGYNTPVEKDHRGLL